MISDTHIFFVLFVSVYAAAYLFGAWDELRTRRSHRQILRLTSLVLVVAALYFWRGRSRGSPLELSSGWIFAGMLSCFIGDLITGGILPVRKPFLVAMAAFSVGHVFYLLAIVAAGSSLGVPPSGLWWPIGALIGVVAWTTAVRRKSESTVLNPLSLGYALLLGSVLGGGLWLATARVELTVLAAGMTLFSISDVLLGNREVRRKCWFLMYDVIWLFYILGQLLIVWSIPFSLVHD